METLTVLTVTTDRYGELTTIEDGSVTGFLAWGEASSVKPPGGRGESVATSADLFARTPTTLKARHRVKRASGETFRVLAGPRWDVHPVTGRPTGWAVFPVEALTG